MREKLSLNNLLQELRNKLYIYSYGVEANDTSLYKIRDTINSYLRSISPPGILLEAVIELNIEENTIVLNDITITSLY